VQLEGAVECDEVYVTAGHKGHPEAVRKKGGQDGATVSKGFGVAAPLKRETTHFGMIQRGGEVVIRMLANVQQATIEPLIKATILPGTQVYTDEYAIYHPLPEWGYAHKTVCHGAANTMAMASVKFMSIRWKAFGRSCVPGCVHVEGFLKKSYRCTWAFCVRS